MLSRITLICLALISTSTLISQTKYDSIYISREKAIEDLIELDRKIQNNYKPYDLPIVIEGYQSELQKVKQQLPDSITLSDLRLEVLSIIDQLGESHFLVGFKSKETKKTRKTTAVSAPLNKLPFDLSLQGVYLRVHHDYRIESLPLIDSIIAIGGRPIVDILTQMNRYFLYDIKDQLAKNHFMARLISPNFKLFNNHSSSESVLVKSISNNQVIETEVAYVSRLKKKRPDRYRSIDSLSTVIIKIESINDYESYSDSLWYPLFKKAKTALPIELPQNIILDLRGCRGGAAATTRKWLSFFLENGSEIYRTNKNILIPFSRGLNFKTGSKIKARKKTKSNWIHKGKTFVLIDEAVFSGGVILSSVLKRYSKATIIGQPTGGKYYGTNAGYSKILDSKNSKVSIVVPQIYIRADGAIHQDLRLEGVQPDISLSYDYDANNTEDHDATMEYVLALIKKSKNLDE